MEQIVFVSGGVSYNSIVTLPEFFEPKPQTIHSCDYLESIGNTGAAKALALSQLGFKTVLHSLIGKDYYGDKITQKLNHPNLNLAFDIDSKGTERHLNILNHKGERISIFTNPSSENVNVDYLKYKDAVKTADFVVINISSFCRNIIPIAKSFSKKIWTDLHDYDGMNPYHNEFIDAADYIFLSSINFEGYKDFMIQMIDKGKELVVCTHGEKGSIAFNRNKEWVEIPAVIEYQLVNSNGAGDSFFAGFLHAFASGYSLDVCMQHATISGGLCVNSESLVSEILNPQTLKKELAKFF